MDAVKVDGVWLAARYPVSQVARSTRFGDGPCGSDAASCVVGIRPGDDSAWLRLGRTFEVWTDGVLTWGGVIREMTPDYPRTVHAKGWAQAEDRVKTVVGERWGRTPANVSYTPVADTDPSWFLDAAGLEIGVADEGLYTRVVATYVSAVAGDPPEPSETATVTVDDAAAQDLYGIVTFELDLTPLGLMSSGAATSWAEDQLAEFTIPQWLSRVTVDSTRLRSLGGLPAHLPNVKAGQRVRLFNVPRLLGGIQSEMSLDVTLGEVQHSEDDPRQVTIAPLGLAVRNLADAVREISETRRLAEQVAAA